MKIFPKLLAIILAAVCDLSARAASPTDSGPAIDFGREIAPLFNQRCAACHGAEKQEAGLRLDHRKSALRGGDSGPLWVAGRSAESELVRRITAEDPDERMPPAEKGPALATAEIERLKRWIDQGAAWPESADDRAQPATKHWSYQPIRRPTAPKVANATWVRSPIDAFILNRLDQEHLAASPEADRETLLRRLYLDLLGLLPTPQEREEFLTDRQPDAYERLVDRLLASPHFGERWGRHWLDLARYGDSNGYELDIVRPNAWRYRDWVIQAVNADMPYDRFVTEQLAGDLLPAARLEQRVATGFHRMTIKNTESGINAEDYRNREMVDRVNTTSAAVLGISLGCAQCHSHKYDPLTQQEYYRFYAFFNNVEEIEIDLPGTAREKEEYEKALGDHFDKWLGIQARRRMIDALEKTKPDESRAALEKALAGAREQLESQRRLTELGLERWFKETPAKLRTAISAPETLASSLKPDAKVKDFMQRSLDRYITSLPLISERLQTRSKSVEVFAAQLTEPAEVIGALLKAGQDRDANERQLVQEFFETLPAKKDEVSQALRMLVVEERYLPSPHVLALAEATAARRKTHVLLRGDFKQPGPEVQPGTPAVLPQLVSRSKSQAADRLDLARWLADRQNPLVARVAVNQVWFHLFGRGIVATLDDFGVQGDRPSHPELLDWLADELVEQGWSRKRLIRAIVLSSTYRQSSTFRSDLDERDPLNTLIARQGRFRVEAEIIRDLFLSASGLLDRTLGGPTIYPVVPDSVRDIAYKYQLVWPTSEAPVRYRRGMYVHFRRSNPYPSLTVFDAPEGTTCTARRNLSNTPLQALTTLNDPVFVENAQALARHVLTDSSSDVNGGLRQIFIACLNRSPRDAEAAVLKEFFETELAAYRRQPQQAGELVGTYQATGREPAETAAWITVARATMNLDEFLTRP